MEIIPQRGWRNTLGERTAPAATLTAVAFIQVKKGLLIPGTAHGRGSAPGDQAALQPAGNPVAGKAGQPPIERPRLLFQRPRPPAAAPGRGKEPKGGAAPASRRSGRLAGRRPARITGPWASFRRASAA